MMSMMYEGTKVIGALNIGLPPTMSG